MKAPTLIVIGTSMGGLQALQVVLAPLPADFPVPIVVAQHRHKTSDNTLPQMLQRRTEIRISDAEDKDQLEPGRVFLAPADYHLLIERGQMSLSVEDAVNYSRPSIDVLFESAADVYGAGVIGVILTGANSDGALGAARIKALKGRVIVQDPSEAEAPAMPQAAINAVKVDRILRLDAIAEFLVTCGRGQSC